MTPDELLEMHDDGTITRGEVFGHLLETLSAENLAQIRSKLAQRAGWLAAFRPWLSSALAGKGTVAAGRLRRPGQEATEAARAWLGAELQAELKQELVLHEQGDARYEAGSHVLLIEQSPEDPFTWVVEFVEDGRRASIAIATLDLTSSLQADIQSTIDVKIETIPDLPEDVELHTHSADREGSRRLPRQEAA